MTNGSGHGGNDNSGHGGGGNSGPGGGDGGHGGPGGGGGDHKAKIEVDNARFEVREGSWIVSDLKVATRVDPTKVLAEITPAGLHDLDDAASIVVKDGLRFMSHVRSGASS